MSFKVRIKNIGKLADAEISIGEFTVFAGPNSTGKSFVSKLLYSFFDAMDSNHAAIYINALVGRLEADSESLARKEITDAESAELELLSSYIIKLRAVAEGAPIYKPEAVFPDLLGIAKDLLQITNTTQQLPLEGIYIDSRESFFKTIQRTRDGLQTLIEIIEQTNVKELIDIGTQHKIRQNLIRNFQVPLISDLKDNTETASEISAGQFGRFQFSPRNMEYTTNKSRLGRLLPYIRVIYLESPIYWKLKSALESVQHGFYRGIGREQLNGVPGYFYDLARELKFEYTGDMAFPDVYERLTDKGVMGGKIAISKSGDLLFQENVQENERNFSLHTTATGVANLGILALLIERKVLDEDTLLFIDEPEAHLHPAWQVVMAEALFELARQGVNVVIATHSIDILKWLEVHIKKNPKYKRLVALNQFPVKNSGIDEDFETKIENIKEELTKPFSDLYLEGL